MKRSLCGLLCAGLLSVLSPVGAQTASVAVGDLGDLELAFSAVRSLDEVPGPAVPARVGHRGGAMYRIELPRDTRRANYLVGNGEEVRVGQPFVTLDGPEIHHLLLEYSTLETRYEAAKERYEQSREPYRQQALREEQWVAIVDRYLELQLEFEHMRHFQELVQEPTDDSEAITLVAPIDGLIRYQDTPERLVAGTEIAGFLSADALQLRARVPVTSARDLVALALADCRLSVDAVDRVADGFFLTAWSEPVPQDCNVPLNVTVSAQPLYRQSAYAVPRSAVFTRDGKSQVLVRRSDTLVAIDVSLLTPVGNDYAVSAESDLADASVLVTSVSAVQGILLGLGGK
ncbi:MAG: hypothetical protein ABR612_05350 [Chromatocurvus sp.]